MKQAGLTVEQKSATLVIDGETVDRQQLVDLVRVYYLSAGGDLTATESGSFVLEFPNRTLWLLPENTPGAADLVYGVWHDYIESHNLYFNAYIEELPRHWRKRLLGVLRSPSPITAVFRDEEIPAWKLEGPFSGPKFTRKSAIL